MSKDGKGNWAERNDEVFPEDMLRDLDEMLRSEPVIAPKSPARPVPTAQPPARPASVPPPKLKGDPEARRKAQELATQARNAPDQKRAGRFVKQALELDQNCVDTWVVLAHMKATAPDELAEHLEIAVRRGEQGLGAEYIEHHRGHLWNSPEARPYMRARRELGDVLRDLGRSDAAIQHYEALLELDAGDGLRVRDSLVGVYLAMGYLEGARGLLDRFGKHASAAMAWSRVLERYLAGDLAGAAAALGWARRSNAVVEDYLLSKKPMQQCAASSFEPGGEAEAQACAANLLPALVQYPHFVVWLEAQDAAA